MPPKSQQKSLLSFFGKKPSPIASPSKSNTNSNSSGSNNSTPEPNNSNKKEVKKTGPQSRDEVTESLAVKKASKPVTQQKPSALNNEDTCNKSSSDSASLNVTENMDIDPENSDNDDDMPLPRKAFGRSRKRISYRESDNSDEDEEKVTKKVINPFAADKKKKRRLVRRIASDDEDEDEYVPSKAELNAPDDEDMASDISEAEEEEESDDDKPKSTRIKQTARKSTSMTPLADKFNNISVTPSKPSLSAMSQMQLFGNKAAISKAPTTKMEKREERSQKFKEKNEQRYHWLTDIKDLQGNRVDSPDYDPRTLFIPQSAWNKFTAFEKQYWEVKHKHWDTVVFFKKGKFYELYEKDADIGHKEFDLKLTDRVNMRMVGVPEMSFDYWTAQFIAKGYKVAKVDQMETAIGKSMREKAGAKTNKADKVIRRELTSILTAGTLVDSGLLTKELGTYCMSIKEVCGDEASAPSFGICFVDTATAEFNLVHFEDDVHRTKFETLIMQLQPRELLTEKGRLSRTTTRLLKSTLQEPLWNMLMPETEFWDARTAKDEIEINDYFAGDRSEALNMALTEAEADPLLMSAFGALIWYLRSLKLDKELLSAKNIQMYDPIRNATSLVLDGQTLANLEIFQNSHDGTTEGTVYKLLSHSITPFGKRLFKQWLCHPLRSIQDINARLDAVEDFMRLIEMQASLAKQFASLPDLERLISRIHAGRVKVKEFLDALQGFGKLSNIMNEMKESRMDIQSSLLGQLIDGFPQIDDELQKITESFITAEVDIDYQKTKTIIPRVGHNEEWDSINRQITEKEDSFQDHLKQVKKQLKTSSVTFKDLGKDLYQMEMPKNVKVPDNWIQISSTSKVSRYWDSTVKTMVTEYKELLETKNAFVKEFAVQVYASFDTNYTMWLQAVQTIAHVDALLGLAKSSANMGEPCCRPQFVDEERSVIEFEELRHPCVVPGIATDFIPNDVVLGDSKASIIVLTGPNMGGKSTLLRQTCVAIILAQLGGYVPAKSCRMTPCDRIYTRIGANDNIMGGQSTFMVELAETSKILKEATPRSMVILDELGRGTSTFDGYAIAYSVLHYLSTHIGCLGMFATHYQTLCKEFERNPEINNMHMGYIMDEDEQNVTFLYKLTPGICEKSFGMNVATMAGIPASVVARATQVAEEVQASHQAKDSTYRMDIDADNFVTPAVIADISYLLSKKRRDKMVTSRILRSFQNLISDKQ